MVSRSPAQPHSHHLELVQGLVGDIRRNLARLGMMRGLTVVQLGASGAYRISIAPAEVVRPTFLAGFGVALPEAIGLIDDVLDYDTADEAAVLVVESNPIDGALVTFLIQDLSPTR